MNQLNQTLQGINWNFSDYNSSKYPLDINSIPWYPATFIPPIPKFLIALLTQPGDVVLDPFGGKGTTAVEAIKLGRMPIYNDLNPFASEITSTIFHTISYCLDKENTSGDDEASELEKYMIRAEEVAEFVSKYRINPDAFKWYDLKTLVELLSIMHLMYETSSDNPRYFHIRKLAFTSILKFASSQPGHFTYVTDNCKPALLVYKDAKKLYLDRIKQITLAAQELAKQFTLTNPNDDLSQLIKETRIETGDARHLGWIKDASVNLVLTSPPYLCAQDYIKTMRLTNLFFSDSGFEDKPKLEIGSRNRRRSKVADIVVNDFYADMNLVFSEIKRVLVDGGYFCLVIGQGKARITNAYDTVGDLCHDLVTQHGFYEIHREQRKISSRSIQVGGVDKEDIIIFQKN